MPHSIPVLCYHNVSQADGHTPQRFEEHLAAIRDAGFRTIGALELLRALRGDIPVAPKTCVLTFDDCHLSNWTLAAPLLAKYSMTGVFFCVTDFIGSGAARLQLAPEARGAELAVVLDHNVDAVVRLGRNALHGVGQQLDEAHGHLGAGHEHVARLVVV